MVLTKLDGSAKGGIVFAVETELGIPVKLVGIGETIGDLVPFDPDEFVDASSRFRPHSLARSLHSVELDPVSALRGTPVGERQAQ